MVAGGYVVETLFVEVLAVMTSGLCAVQIVVGWRLPSNKPRVAPLHRTLHPLTLASALIITLLSLDFRAVYGLYSPQAVVTLCAIDAIVITAGVLVWFKEVFNVVRASEPKLFMEYQNLKVTDMQIGIAVAINALITIICLIVSFQTDKIWYFAIIFSYLDVLAFFAFLLSSAFIYVLQKQFKQNNAPSASDTRSAMYKIAMTRTVSSCALSILFFIGLALTAGTLTQKDLSLMTEFSADPQNYSVNVESVVLFIWSFFLMYQSLYNSWLPVTWEDITTYVKKLVSPAAEMTIIGRQSLAKPLVESDGATNLNNSSGESAANNNARTMMSSSTMMKSHDFSVRQPSVYPPQKSSAVIQPKPSLSHNLSSSSLPPEPSIFENSLVVKDPLITIDEQQQQQQQQQQLQEEETITEQEIGQ
eukprot:TRINITY_DN3220_c1_g7_i1.p1 TRINITY_DN3220_c1_g7~~TRINITY_DN3220_c1_g7_i1.p1  ORF type:complete len:418 (-),score=88.84 TRINITY_DN3220_c1_g7_i1:26-1279(-)